MPLLRRPTATLASCLWLPRFIDKARLHLAGALPADFVQPFCHPLATDGAFLAHFSLPPDALLAAIAAAPDDAGVAAWFLAQPGVTPERIQAWNTLAPHLGKPGFPVERGLPFMLQRLYGGTPDPRVNSVFTAIAYDEGFLDEL